MNVTGQRILTALTLATVTAGAWAQTQTASNAAPATPSAEASIAPAPTPDQQLRSEVEELKQLVHEQQQRIEALEAGRTAGPEPPDMVASVTPITSAPTAYPASDSKHQVDESQPQPQNAPRAQNVQAGSSDERIRNLERQIKGLGPISLAEMCGFARNHSLAARPTTRWIARARASGPASMRSPILVPSSARASLWPRAMSTIPPRPMRT